MFSEAATLSNGSPDSRSATNASYLLEVGWQDDPGDLNLLGHPGYTVPQLLLHPLTQYLDPHEVAILVVAYPASSQEPAICLLELLLHPFVPRASRRVTRDETPVKRIVDVSLGDPGAEPRGGAPYQFVFQHGPQHVQRIAANRGCAGLGEVQAGYRLHTVCYVAGRQDRLPADASHPHLRRLYVDAVVGDGWNNDDRPATAPAPAGQPTGGLPGAGRRRV